MPTWIIHVIGNIGVVFILLAYILVSTGRVKSLSVRYQVMNLVGAVIIAAYSVVFSAWASVALNTIWAGIAAVSWIRLTRTRAAA